MLHNKSNRIVIMIDQTSKGILPKINSYIT